MTPCKSNYSLRSYCLGYCWILPRCSKLLVPLISRAHNIYIWKHTLIYAWVGLGNMSQVHRMSNIYALGQQVHIFQYTSISVLFYDHWDFMRIYSKLWLKIPKMSTTVCLWHRHLWLSCVLWVTSLIFVVQPLLFKGGRLKPRPVRAQHMLNRSNFCTMFCTHSADITGCVQKCQFPH